MHFFDFVNILSFKMTPIITLTTYFGTKDSYVAAMKGIILTIYPDAKIIDLSHEISSQNIMGTNLFVASACPYFPKEQYML